MSDDESLFDGMKGEANELNGLINLAGNLDAVKQRNKLLAQQNEAIALAKKNAELATARLEIEKKRFHAEGEERERRRAQEDQLKALRKSIADSVVELSDLKKNYRI